MPNPTIECQLAEFKLEYQKGKSRLAALRKLIEIDTLVHNKVRLEIAEHNQENMLQKIQKLERLLRVPCDSTNKFIWRIE